MLRDKKNQAKERNYEGICVSWESGVMQVIAAGMENQIEIF